MQSSKNSVFVSKLHVFYVAYVFYVFCVSYVFYVICENYGNYKKNVPSDVFFLHISKKSSTFVAQTNNTHEKMKRLLPWLVGFGLLAVVAVIAANIYDTVVYNAEEDEPAWVEPTDSTEYLDK